VEAQRLCPSLEVVRFERAGHNIRREAFEEFMDAVTGFLARNADGIGGSLSDGR
jgi:hypothetical protein